MQVDMALPVCMGIVEKVRPNVFRIKQKYERKPPQLTNHLKTMMTDLYLEFGETEFTLEQVMDTFRMPSSTASATLHQLVLLRIIGCEKCNSRVRRHTLSCAGTLSFV